MSSQQASSLRITNARLIDGTGAAPVEGATLVVDAEGLIA